jgi:Kef-type K+ transport system membrane component KefB
VDLTEQAALFALQVGIVLIAAKIGGEVFERWLLQPAVLGELVAGVLIGPYAIGAVAWPVVGRVFGDASAAAAIPIPTPLWVFAELAAVVLLFVAGLETDFAAFVRFGPTAIVVAVGGVILPFAFGDVAAVAAGFAPGYLSPGALFVGAALTATSVGVTARVLGDLGKLDTPEGVTILGAAVFDDVIGILVLAVVVAISQSAGVTTFDVGIVGLKAVGAWALLTGVLILAANRIATLFSGFRSPGATLALAIGLALVSGYVAQSAGLAMIVGAFSCGVALSRSHLRATLAHDARAVFQLLVPAFFVIVGMLVDLPALGSVIAFGTVLTILAIGGKVVGCAVPALALGFERIGALRVGIGMIPRGEVALIIAGIGLSNGAIDRAIFGVVIFMTFGTTVLAPILLLPAFRRGGPGFRADPSTAGGTHIDLNLTVGLFELFERHLLSAFERRGFEVGGSSGADSEIIRQFRRSSDVVVTRSFEPTGGSRRMHVESEHALPDWPGILAEAVDATSRESELELRRLSATRRP